MSGVLRSSFKLYSSIGVAGFLGRNLVSEPANSRLYSTLWNNAKIIKNMTFKTTTALTNLYCINNHYSTESDAREIGLTQFLNQEIAAEEKIQKSQTIPSKIDDFQVSLDGPNVTLTKQSLDETIEIKFNINFSLQEIPVGAGQSEQDFTDSDVEMVSKPSFEIYMKKENVTLGVYCTYLENENESDFEEDVNVYQINEITVFKGEKTDNTYAISGDILDGTLYNLLMNYLEEKGITDDFLIRMSDLATAYERSSYISLLRELKRYAS